MQTKIGYIHSPPKKKTDEVCLSLYCSTDQYLYNSYTDMEGNYQDIQTGVLRLGETAIHLGETKYTFGRRTNIRLGEEKFMHLGERKIIPGNISY